MRKQLWAPAICAALLVAFVADLRLQPGGGRITRGIDDIAQLVAAALASGAATWRARNAAGRMRASWALIGIGAGCWAIGEAIWSYYELIASVATPFPSSADIGYLLFPIFTAVAIVVRPSRAFAGRGWARIVLDILLVVVSLFSISWATALGSVYRGANDARLSTIVSLAYPASDVALLTVVVVVLSYASAGGRLGLTWLGAGLIAFAVADSGFAYMTAVGTYRTGNLIDACWVGGFLVLACSTVFDLSTKKGLERHSVTPRGALLLPYVPSGIGMVVALVHLHTSGSDTVMIVVAAAAVWLLVARQILVLLDNRALMVHITHQALHDVLTGLGNRALFADRLEHALELHRRDLRAVTLLLIDLDDFKTVNDSLGHPCGDELLIRVSERLRASVRAGDTVARLGGDEFAILVEDGGDPLHAVDRILLALEQPVDVGHRSIPVGASIGMASLMSDDASASATDMLRRADVAMYAAKRNGKGQMSRYASDLPDVAEMDGRQVDIRAALAVDLQTGRIEVALQPIRRPDGGLFGAEALARWRFQGEPVTPAVFLPIATRLGLAATLDRIVLRQAVTAAVRWDPDVVLSVNLCRDTLTDPDFSPWVATVLAEFDFSARRLAVEVLETHLIESDLEAMNTLIALRAQGVRIMVDDFGIGYAALARLHALAPDVVKIDRTLICAHDESPTPSGLLDAVTEMAHQLGALVIAEGIETDSQLSAAVAAGCDAMQGFLLGRPTIDVELSRISAAAA